jgi:S-adenosylmethionine synthetase
LRPDAKSQVSVRYVDNKPTEIEPQLSFRLSTIRADQKLIDADMKKELQRQRAEPDYANGF